jgi:hypothetical protein
MFNTAKVRNQEMFSVKKFVVLAGAILLCMQVAHAQVIYRETFGGPATGNTNFDSVGWLGYWSPTAQPDDGVVVPFNNFGVGNSLGIPTNLTNVNAGAMSETNGFPFASGFQAVSNNILTYTTSTNFTGTISPSNIGSISFYSGNTSNLFPNGMPGYRIAVEIDTNWFVSAQLLTQSNNIANAAAFNTSGQQLVFNWPGSTWDSLNFVPGSTSTPGVLILGSLTTLPTDNLMAFGLYSDPAVNTNGLGGVATRRWDTYEIDAIPEPSSVALVFIGLGALLGLRRSRKA